MSGFTFPEEPDRTKANFQFVVELRIRDAGGEPQTLHTLRPFWECDPKKEKDPNYVRMDSGSGAGPPSMFDIKKIDDWDQVIFRVRARILDAMRVSVYDVNRDDWWDAVLEILRAIPSAVDPG